LYNPAVTQSTKMAMPAARNARILVHVVARDKHARELFAGSYGLFAGIVFLVVFGVVFAPVVHHAHAPLSSR